jgi:hypothetical protein
VAEGSFAGDQAAEDDVNAEDGLEGEVEAEDAEMGEVCPSSTDVGFSIRLHPTGSPQEAQSRRFHSSFPSLIASGSLVWDCSWCTGAGTRADQQSPIMLAS